MAASGAMPLQDAQLSLSCLYAPGLGWAGLLVRIWVR